MKHGHAHDVHSTAAGHSMSVLGRALAITLSFSAVEAAGGWWSGSLALLSDAGHMLTDSAALGFAALSARIAQRPPSTRHSYGLVRAEVMAGLLNALVMFVLIGFIAYEAVSRLRSPAPVAGGVVALIAAAGLVVNVGVAFTLSRGEHNLNTRAALLHVMGDLLGSVAALAAGAVILVTGWTPIDPILSFVVSALVLFSAINLMREALHVLMEGVPAHIDLEAVSSALGKISGVSSVHDLHVWSMGSETISLTAHLEIPDPMQWARILEEACGVLSEDFGIEHVTLQPEVRAVRFRH